MRIHIPIGKYIASVMIGTSVTVLFLGLMCGDANAALTKTPNASAAPQVLFVYNDADFTSTVQVVNTTDAPLPLPRPCEMTTCAHPQLAPHSVASYATSGIGTTETNFDSGLTVYSQFVSRYGLLRVEQCVAVDSLWIHDLIPPGTNGYNSGIFVAALDKDAVVSLDGGRQVSLIAHQGAVLPNTSNVAHLVTVQGSGKVCAFAYGNKQQNGSLFAVTH